MPTNMRDPLSTQIRQRYDSDNVFRTAVAHMRVLLEKLSVDDISQALALAVLLEAEIAVPPPLIQSEEAPDADAS